MAVDAYHHLRFSRPFLATDIRQWDSAWSDSGGVTEAVIFDRAALCGAANWAAVQANLQLVAERRGPVIFHFPVNDSNYILDGIVRDRLWQVLDVLDAVGAIGLVLHSNQTMPTAYWTASTTRAAQERFAAFIPRLQERITGSSFWVGLENMPIMGNDGSEFDPVLVYPEDFTTFEYGVNLGITWDFCHYSYTVHVGELLQQGSLREHRYYPHLRRDCSIDSLWALREHVLHLHFSAFTGVATVDGGGECREGVVPWESTLGIRYYEDLLLQAAGRFPQASTVTLEITEDDYLMRKRFGSVYKWGKAVLAGGPRIDYS